MRTASTMLVINSVRALPPSEAWFEVTLKLVSRLSRGLQFLGFAISGVPSRIFKAAASDSAVSSARQVSQDFMIYSSEKPFLFLEPEAPNRSRQFLISAERAENI